MHSQPIYHPCQVNVHCTLEEIALKNNCLGRSRSRTDRARATVPSFSPALPSAPSQARLTTGSAPPRPPIPRSRHGYVASLSVPKRMTNSNGHSGIDSKGGVFLMKLKCEKPHLSYAVELLEFLAFHVHLYM